VKIKVKGITSSGLDIQKTVTPTEIGLEDNDAGIKTPLGVSARIEIAGKILLAKTRVNVTFLSECARCLKPIEQTRQKEYIFDYPFDKQTEFIDLGEDIRQEIILDVPPRILCKENCKGICVGCGVDLNEEKCVCKKKSKGV